MAVIGVDIGSTGCKATIVSENGAILAQAYREYREKKCEVPQWQEVSSNEVWRCTAEVISACAAQHKGEPVAALSVSSFGEAVTLVDDCLNVLSDGILYTDPRGDEETAWLLAGVEADAYMGIAGVGPSKMYSLPKLMWLKQHKPEAYRNARAFLPFDGFALAKLGAKLHTSYSLAARTMAFDVVNKRWSAKILDIAGIDGAKCPEAVPSGTVVGQLSREAAHLTGLPEGILLVSGGHDQPCASLGAGAIYSGLATDGLGSVESINPTFDEPRLNAQMAQGSFACVPHVLPEKYITYAFTFTAGRLFKWYRDTLGSEECARAQRANRNVYELLIEEMSPEANDLFLLPYFAGAATPYMDYTSKGALVGMTLETTKPDIVRALLEGITFESMVNVEHLERAGVSIRELVATGGLANSRAFLQMKADMMGRPIHTIASDQAGTMGVAILAGVAVGVYGSIEEAVSLVVKKGTQYEPDFKRHQRYLEKYERYKRIYPAMKHIFAENGGRQ